MASTSSISTPDKAVSLYLKPRNRNSTNPEEGKAPDKIRCYIGGEWKSRSEFSARQLDKYIRSGTKPGNSKISCRVHSAQQRRELCCEGPCGSWLPLESFSKNTRTRGKVWCLNCTEWQLSVEPGFTPYVPPAPVDGINEFPLLEAADGFSGDKGEEHIESWIEGNPSEVDGYERLEIGTQRSAIDTPSEASVPIGRSLLDNDDPQILGGLPQALNAINLGKNDAVSRHRQSEGSEGSGSTAGLATRPGPSRPTYAGMLTAPPQSNALTKTSNRGKNADWLLLDDTTETAETSSDTSSDKTFTFANTSKAPSVAPSASHTNTTTTAATPLNTAVTTTVNTTTTVTHTSWMEAEFVPLRLPQSNPAPASTVSESWARPTQRKTDFYTPKYVVNGAVQDPHSQSFQKTVYADMDDDDSEDEC